MGEKTEKDLKDRLVCCEPVMAARPSGRHATHASNCLYKPRELVGLVGLKVTDDPRPADCDWHQRLGIDYFVAPLCAGPACVDYRLAHADDDDDKRGFRG